MRWTTSKKQKELAERYQKQEDRIVSKILWLPINIDGQWRMWEKVHVQQTVFHRNRYLFGGVKYFWVDVKWVE